MQQFIKHPVLDNIGGGGWSVWEGGRGRNDVNEKRSLTKDELFEIAQKELGVEIKKSSTKGALLQMLEEGLPEEEFQRLSFKTEKEISQEIQEKIRKTFKLNGIMVDNEENLHDVAGDRKSVV